MTPAILARLMDSEPPKVCAWCPDFRPAPGKVSHGICPACAQKLEAEAGV